LIRGLRGSLLCVLLGSTGVVGFVSQPTATLSETSQTIILGCKIIRNSWRMYIRLIDSPSVQDQEHSQSALERAKSSVESI
jgi:hypothetical protein